MGKLIFKRGHPHLTFWPMSEIARRWGKSGKCQMAHGRTHPQIWQAASNSPKFTTALMVSVSVGTSQQCAQLMQNNNSRMHNWTFQSFSLSPSPSASLQLARWRWALEPPTGAPHTCWDVSRIWCDAPTQLLQSRSEEAGPVEEPRPNKQPSIANDEHQQSDLHEIHHKPTPTRGSRSELSD